MPMRDSSFLWMGLLTLVASVSVESSIMAAEPPAMDIPVSALGGAGDLGSQYVAQIDAWLEYRRGQIADATEIKQVVDAGTNTLNDYRRYDSPSYRYTFAGRAAAILTTLLGEGLKKEDNLLRLKEITVAMVLSKMSQVTASTALETMVVHANPGVRFLGWEGYRSARALILAQSPAVGQKMFDTLAAAAAKEDSAPVLGAAFLTLNISSFTSPSLSPGTVKDAQTRAFEILQTNWLRWCMRVANGDLEMSRAFAKSIETVQTLAAAGVAGDPTKAKVLQWLVDLMRCSAQAYDDAGTKGAIGAENGTLLKNCETAIIAISQVRKSHVGTPLADEKMSATERGPTVREGVIYWMDDLKDLGVVKSNIGLPATTRPATRAAESKPAASGPATQSRPAASGPATQSRPAATRPAESGPAESRPS
jgi:hypothetical protein